MLPFVRLPIDIGTDNPNVHSYMLYWLLVQLSNGVVISGVLVSYLSLITDKSTMKVGFAEAFFGLCALFPGLYGGYLSDNNRRDRVIKIGGMSTLIGCCLMIVAMVLTISSHGVDNELDNTTTLGEYKFLIVSGLFAVLYAAQSFGDSSARAIMADSLTTGHRLEFMKTLTMYSKFCYGLGPVFSIVFFLTTGNDWTERQLSILIIIGLALKIPAGLITLQFNDDNCLGDESMALVRNKPPPGSPKRSRLKNYAMVPVYYYLSDFIWCTGGGMSTKFYPLFFQDKDGGLGMSPAVVLSIIAALPFLVIPVTRAAVWVAFKIGRIQCDFILWYIGTACLLGMVVMGYTGRFTMGLSDRLITTGLYLSRSALLQTTAVLQQSVIMDYVPKKKRAKWASLDAITQVGWSGSAALGGVLISKYSYQAVFLGTAIMYYVSTVVKIPLFWIVPKRQETVVAKDPLAVLRVVFLKKQNMLTHRDIMGVTSFFTTPEEIAEAERAKRDLSSTSEEDRSSDIEDGIN